MERGSTQHSPRLDEALDADTAALTHGTPHEGHVEENRWQEGPADDEPAPDGLVVGDAQPSRFLDLGLDEVEVRSELARSLRPGIFPASGAELLVCAQDEGAFEWVIDALADLPADDTYPTVQAVWIALGGPVEHRDHLDASGGGEVPVPEPPTSREEEESESPADLDDDAESALPPGEHSGHLASPALAFVARVVGFGLRATAVALDAAGRKLGA
ncbi:MAG: hypothetical protein JWL73_3530 [Actinomycetia bacterium]|nr:hypothetical protein [Actinomycetes bacterium]